MLLHWVQKAAEFLKITSGQIEDGELPRNFQPWNRNN